MTVSKTIPAAFNSYGEPTRFVPTNQATGAQLALAIHYQNQAGRYELNKLWRLFRAAGGTAGDRVGEILRDTGG